MAATDDTLGLPLLRGERFGALLLSRVVVTSALTTVLVALLCAALAPVGLWVWWLVLPLTLGLGLVAFRVSRVVSARALPVWVSVTLAALAVGTTVWAGVTHSEQVLPRRDAGSYAQAATYLATQHRTPVAVDVDRLGGPGALRIDGVTLESPAFYQVGSAEDPSVQPQFMIGAAAWFSIGHWLAGPLGMLVTPAVFGGLTVLAVGLLTSRVVGARWAPMGAAATVLAFPFLHTVRAAYSEPLALLALTVGLLALTEGTRAGNKGRGRQAVALGLLAGLLIGGGGLIRADALRETVLLLPVGALLLIRRNPVATPLLSSAGVATLVSALVGLGLSDRYLGDIAGSLLPLLALAVVVAAACLAVVVAARRGVRLPSAVRTALPWAAASLVALVGVVLVSRPLWQTVRQSAADPGSRVVAALQSRQGLEVDGGRTYAEQTMAWTAWWVGWPALVLTFVVLSVAAYTLAASWVRATVLPTWTGPFLVSFGSSVLVWWRPGITPDHPWADRRLLVVLGMVAVCSTAAAAWPVRYAARRLPATVLALSVVLLPAVVLVPMALATWPHATERVERGALAAVDQVCRSFERGDVALMVDDRAANEWPQVVRGRCGVPALSLTSAVRRDDARREAAVSALGAQVAGAGGRLVLLAADDPGNAAGEGRQVEPVLDNVVLEDPRLLERRPDRLVTLPLQVWLGRT